MDHAVTVDDYSGSDSEDDHRRERAGSHSALSRAGTLGNLLCTSSLLRPQLLSCTPPWQSRRAALRSHMRCAGTRRSGAAARRATPRSSQPQAGALRLCCLSARASLTTLPTSLLALRFTSTRSLSLSLSRSHSLTHSPAADVDDVGRDGDGGDRSRRGGPVTLDAGGKRKSRRAKALSKLTGGRLGEGRTRAKLAKATKGRFGAGNTRAAIRAKLSRKSSRSTPDEDDRDARRGSRTPSSRL